MLKNWKLWSGFFGFILVLSSCGPTAHIEKDDNTNFSKYKTFAWIDRDGTGTKDKNPANDLTEQKVKDAVSKELEKTAGWHQTNRRPDLLLSYDVLVERTTKEQSDPVYTRGFTRTFFNPYSRRVLNVYYPSQFAGYDSYTVNTREGTVTISMIDSKTEKTVWQGWATDEIDSRKMSGKEIENSVKAIFKKFDVAKN